MTGLFKIDAYNTEALYFWGGEYNLDRYVDFLNRNREVNLYGYEAIPEEQWSEFDDYSGVTSDEETGWDDFMIDEE